VWCFASSHTSTFELIPAVATAQPGALVTIWIWTWTNDCLSRRNNAVDIEIWCDTF